MKWLLWTNGLAPELVIFNSGLDPSSSIIKHPPFGKANPLHKAGPILTPSGGREYDAD